MQYITVVTVADWVRLGLVALALLFILYAVFDFYVIQPLWAKRKKRKP